MLLLYHKNTGWYSVSTQIARGFLSIGRVDKLFVNSYNANCLNYKYFRKEGIFTQPSFHYLLMIDYALFQKKLLEKVRPYGLSMGQPKILDYLKDHNGASQKEIAAACQIEAGSLTSVLNRMEEKGMVQRKMLHGDRRTYHIFLTPFGEEQKKHVEQAFEELEQQALSGFTPEECQKGRELMQAIFRNLQKEEPNE